MHQLRRQQVEQRNQPLGLREKCRNHIRKIHDADTQKNSFDPFGRACNHDRPDQQTSQRHRNEPADAKRLARPENACELRHDIAEIHDEDCSHQKERNAKSELLAD